MFRMPPANVEVFCTPDPWAACLRRPWKEGTPWRRFKAGNGSGRTEGTAG